MKTHRIVTRTIYACLFFIMFVFVFGIYSQAQKPNINNRLSGYPLTAANGGTGATDGTTGTLTPGSGFTGSSLTWTNTQSFRGLVNLKAASTTQANWPGTLAVAPVLLDGESGSSGTPVTANYLSKPNVFWSRYAAITTASCESGLLNLCAAPVARIAFANVSSTTMSSDYGMIIEGSQFQANTKGTDPAHNYPAGLGIAMLDKSGVVNIVNMVGIDDNVGAQNVPAQCHFGTTGGGNTACARSVNGIEINNSNYTATDAVVDESTIGNALFGNTINFNSPGGGNGSTALSMTTSTVGKGWKFGIGVGGVQTAGIVIPQQGISNKPDIAIHIASQGANGIVCGTGSTTYAHSIGWTLANPTVCLLMDAQRLEGATGTAQSNVLQFRAATGASTYLNFKEFLDVNGTTQHFQTDASGSFADLLTLNGNATASNQSAILQGSLFAAQTLNFKYNGTNYFTLTGAPTAVRTISVQDVSGTLPLIIASGQATMTTAAIGAGACGTTVTVAATNSLTTDTISDAVTTAVTTPNGLLIINKWLTAGNVNFNYCNPTAGSLTPSAATLNWRVIR